MKNLKNKKIFFLPVNTGYGSEHSPNCELIDFYRKRSSNSIYCSIVGNVVIPNGYKSNNYFIKISNNTNWRNLTFEIKSQGSKPGIQLSSAWDGYIGNLHFVAKQSENPEKYYLDAINSIDESKINEIIRDLRHGISLSIDNGFEHIQIHAAHGYLFSLLLDNYFSKYADLFQHELSNIFSELKNHNIETSLRISVKTGIYRIDKKRDNIIKNLSSIPTDYIDLSSGFYNINKNLIYPSTSSMLKKRYEDSIKLINQFKNRKFIISGKSLSLFDKILPENVDVGICRDLIANPNFITKPDLKCNDCGDCHYYSLGKDKLNCSLW